MVKNGIILLSKVCLHYLKEYHQVMSKTFIVEIIFTRTEQKKNLKSMKEYVMIMITVM